MELITEADRKLVKKWKPILEHTDMPVIDGPGKDYKKAVTAQVLENTSKELFLTEDSPANVMGTSAQDVTSGNAQGFEPILVSLLRRSVPNLMAFDIGGVQAMKAPVSLVFAFRPTYGVTAEANSPYDPRYAGANPVPGDPDAYLREVDTRWSAKSSSSAIVSDPNSGFYVSASSTTAGTRYGAATIGEGVGSAITGYEGDIVNEMGFNIDRITVTAKERALRGSYSVQLARDLKNMLSVDAESEIVKLLETELQAEINREFVRKIVLSAKQGANTGYTATAGIFDLAVDSSGRWSPEKVKELAFAVDREANVIAKESRRGKGNIILCSSDVASAFAHAELLHYPSDFKANLQSDDTGNTYAGQMGRFKVYIDPYFQNSISGVDLNYIVVGYKGTNPWDAGIFYCPYVPFELFRATDPKSLQPIVAFRTRYAMTANPFVNGTPSASNAAGFGAITNGTNQYYRYFAVKNIL